LGYCSFCLICIGFFQDRKARGPDTTKVPLTKQHSRSRVRLRRFPNTPPVLQGLTHLCSSTRCVVRHGQAQPASDWIFKYSIHEEHNMKKPTTRILAAAPLCET
jgi:hypothetical protein